MGSIRLNYIKSPGKTINCWQTISTQSVFQVQCKQDHYKVTVCRPIRVLAGRQEPIYCLRFFPTKPGWVHPYIKGSRGAPGQWQYHHHSFNTHCTAHCTHTALHSHSYNTTHSPLTALTAANTRHCSQHPSLQRDTARLQTLPWDRRQVTIGHDGKRRRRRRTVEAGAGAGAGAGVALLPHTEAVYRLLQPGGSHSHTVDRSPPHSTPRPDSQRAGEESGDWRAVLL